MLRSVVVLACVWAGCGQSGHPPGPAMPAPAWRLRDIENRPLVAGSSHAFSLGASFFAGDCSTAEDCIEPDVSLLSDGELTKLDSELALTSTADTTKVVLVTANADLSAGRHEYRVDFEGGPSSTTTFEVLRPYPVNTQPMLRVARSCGVLQRLSAGWACYQFGPGQGESSALLSPDGKVVDERTTPGVVYSDSGMWSVSEGGVVEFRSYEEGRPMAVPSFAVSTGAAAVEYAFGNDDEYWLFDGSQFFVISRGGGIPKSIQVGEERARLIGGHRTNKGLVFGMMLNPTTGAICVADLALERVSCDVTGVRVLATDGDVFWVQRGSALVAGTISSEGAWHETATTDVSPDFWLFMVGDPYRSRRQHTAPVAMLGTYAFVPRIVDDARIELRALHVVRRNSEPRSFQFDVASGFFYWSDLGSSSLPAETELFSLDAG